MKPKNCAECGTTLSPDNRGDWSPYFCKPCDATRVQRIDEQMNSIAAKFGIELPDSPLPEGTK